MSKSFNWLNDGLIYARVNSAALATGDVKAAHISTQSIGNLSLANTIVTGSMVISDTNWHLVGTTLIDVSTGTLSISFPAKVTQTRLSGAGNLTNEAGFSIYSGSAPATPQVSGGSVTLTLANPLTGTGLTLGVYVRATASGTFHNDGTPATGTLSQDLKQVFRTGFLS